MGLLSRGCAWLSAWAKDHTSEQVTVQWPEGSVVLQATPVAYDSDTSKEQIKLQANYQSFLFKTSDLEGVPLRRGLRIVWDGTTYEMILDRRNSWFYNDPYKNDVVINTVMI